MTQLRYAKTRWPEGEPESTDALWFFYEMDDAADVVTRNVEVYADGRATRNSIQIEEQGGVACPSLIDCSLAEGFRNANLETISQDEFQAAWDKGVDTPFWNVR